MTENMYVISKTFFPISHILLVKHAVKVKLPQIRHESTWGSWGKTPVILNLGTPEGCGQSMPRPLYAGTIASGTHRIKASMEPSAGAPRNEWRMLPRPNCVYSLYTDEASPAATNLSLPWAPPPPKNPTNRTWASWNVRGYTESTWTRSKLDRQVLGWFYTSVWNAVKRFYVLSTQQRSNRVGSYTCVLAVC